MFKFALKNMAIKKIQVILVVLSIVISAGVGILAYNTAEQVSEGITSTAGFYSAVIGPSGSGTQLVMNTMYFTEKPVGTIPYGVVEKLQRDNRTRDVVPFAMADSYNGYPLVGTTSAFLSEKELRSGKMFSDTDTFKVVLGSAVAKANSLSVGQVIYTSHSAGEEHHTPFAVVGILEETHTAYDNVVFTELRSIWQVHDHEKHENHEGEEEHDHEELHGKVCAVLVKATNPNAAMTLVNEYNGMAFVDDDGNTFALQAVEPMDAVRSVLDDADNTKYIVFVLCAIILAMNFIIIIIVTLLNMYHATKEIALMRLIGISMKRINLLYMLQNSLIGLTATVLAFGLSRACMLLMRGYVASMGVVINIGRVYPAEFFVLLGIFVITILPTVICTNAMAKKDGLS